FRAAHGGNRFSGSLVTILFSLLAGFFTLFVDAFHVQLPYLLDELFKLLGIECTRLGKYQHILAKCHYRWNRGNTGRCSKLLLVFSIDFAEHNIVVFLRYVIIDRSKHFAWSTPLGPPVDQHNVIAFDG